MRRACLILSISLMSVCAWTQNQTATQAAQGTLPVMFDSVRAIIRDDEVQIAWSNLTEREVSFYLIERSVDGTDFRSVYKQLPRSNLNEKAAYSFVDVNPLEGNSYYRIKVMIINGKIITSRILKAQKGFSSPGFTVYPNPVTEERFNVSLAAVRKGKYVLELVNGSGVSVFKSTMNLQGEGITESFTFPAGFNPGIYVLFVKGEEYSASKLIVKK